MKKIATVAALLTALGGSAALAQGAPPGFTPWHSGWAGNTGLHQATNAQQPSTARTHEQVAAGKSVPVVGNPQGTRRGG